MKNLFQRISGFTLIETMVSIAIIAVVSSAIISIFLVAQRYYTDENQRVRNQQGAVLFLTEVEKSIRQASSQVVYDNFTDLNPVTSGGTCLELTDRNGTPEDASDDITNKFYLSGDEGYGKTDTRDPRRLARNVSFLSFNQNNLYVQVYLYTSGEPEMRYQTSAIMRN
ncbi:MAG: prepilin-type N-terminal cleavage/methylation domain-containing protein [Candidatus Omnitrophota bacterium]